MWNPNPDVLHSSGLLTRLDVKCTKRKSHIQTWDEKCSWKLVFMSFVCILCTTNVMCVDYVGRHRKNMGIQIRKSQKKALIKWERQWGKKRNDCIAIVKVFAVRQAAVSPGSFSNPGLLCLVCVCLCVNRSVLIWHNSRPYGFKPFCTIHMVSALSHKHVVIVLCCCVLNSNFHWRNNNGIKCMKYLDGKVLHSMPGCNHAVCFKAGLL